MGRVFTENVRFRGDALYNRDKFIEDSSNHRRGDGRCTAALQSSSSGDSG